MSESETEKDKRLARERQQRYYAKYPGIDVENAARYRQKKEDEEFAEVFTKTMNSLEQMMGNIICVIKSLDDKDPNYDEELHNLFGKLVGFADLVRIRDGPESINNPLVKWVNELPRTLQLDHIAHTVKPTRFDDPNFKFRSADYPSPETPLTYVSTIATPLENETTN